MTIEDDKRLRFRCELRSSTAAGTTGLLDCNRNKHVLLREPVIPWTLRRTYSSTHKGISIRFTVLTWSWCQDVQRYSRHSRREDPKPWTHQDRWIAPLLTISEHIYGILDDQNCESSCLVHYLAAQSFVLPWLGCNSLTSGAHSSPPLQASYLRYH